MYRAAVFPWLLSLKMLTRPIPFMHDNIILTHWVIPNFRIIDYGNHVILTAIPASKTDHLHISFTCFTSNAAAFPYPYSPFQ
jgi:hypothetical protein